MAFEWSCHLLVTSMWVTTTELHAALAGGPGIAEGFEVCVPDRSDSLQVGILTCIDRLGWAHWIVPRIPAVVRSQRAVSKIYSKEGRRLTTVGKADPEFVSWEFEDRPRLISHPIKVAALRRCVCGKIAIIAGSCFAKIGGFIIGKPSLIAIGFRWARQMQ
jgi:hypothetical protein